MENLARLVTLVFEQGVKSISIYMASAQNFRRTDETVEAFSRAEAIACDTLLRVIVERFQVEVRVTGNLAVAPEVLRTSVKNLVAASSKNASKRLYLCVAYDPFEEIEAALRVRQGRDCLPNYLEVPEPLDLVIRSGGANCLSNFLPLQAGFARLYFLEKLFTDVTTDDVQTILNEFRKISTSRLYGE